MRLAENLSSLSDSLKNGTYRQGNYYTFMVHDPKDRVIHALRYPDRVVQHCLCDRILAPAIDRRLIYDNAACRIEKGTDFALNRLSGFLRAHYRRHGTDGFFLKCDIRKFFDNIDHDVLKEKLRRVFSEDALLKLLDHIIDSYCTAPGKGLPLGNQTSQWFAIYYLDGLDRLVKERCRMPFYTRYMDDFVLVYHDREQLTKVRRTMADYLEGTLKLSFNEKTQIIPLKNGCPYLGFRFYLSDSGKVFRKLGNTTKTRMKHRMKKLSEDYAARTIDFDDAKQVITSYRAHLSKGHCFRLQKSDLLVTLKRDPSG